MTPERKAALRRTYAGFDVVGGAAVRELLAALDAAEATIDAALDDLRVAERRVEDWMSQCNQARDERDRAERLLVAANAAIERLQAQGTENTTATHRSIA